MSDPVYQPDHYAGKPTETIHAIEAVVDGLDARSAYLLGNIIKYVDRRDDKGHPEQDLAKANNYAHRLVTGHWRDKQHVTRQLINRYARSTHGSNTTARMRRIRQRGRRSRASAIYGKSGNGDQQQRIDDHQGDTDQHECGDSTTQGTDSRGRVRWTPDKLDFMAEIIPGHSESEIRAMFLERYGIELTEGQIGNTKAKLGIKSGTRGGQFAKGHVPYNKGMTWDEQGRSEDARERSLATCFKPGNEPSNGKKRSVGEERLSKDGFVEVKVSRFSGVPGANKCWKPKHRLIWEQVHGKPVPPSTVIMFADGNRLNFDPDNLVAVSRSDLSTINHEGLQYSDRATLLAAVDIAQLKHGINKARLHERICKQCNHKFTPRYAHQRTCDACLGR